MVTYIRREVRGRYGISNVATFDKVDVDIAVVLGTTTMPIHQVLRLGRGAIIELDASEDDAVNVLANDLPVAKGTVVVNGNRIAVEVGELLARPLNMR
jgi:flagellar motor switch protein FliN/FliY